jgi:hypothetical protein
MTDVVTVFVCSQGHTTLLTQVAKRDRDDQVVRCRYLVGARMECSREAHRREVRIETR